MSTDSTMDTGRFTLRAADVIERTGIPRTTFHFYLREGLLPPAYKPARNSALYGEDHVARVLLIRRLRSEEFGGLSIPQIHRVLDRTEKGVSAEVAVQMETSMGVRAAGDDRWDAGALAARQGVPESFVREAVGLGLLVPDPFGRVAGFDALEGTIVAALHDVTHQTGLCLEDLAPVAAMIRKLAAMEMEIRARAVANCPRGQANAEVTLSLQRLGNLLHPYLISRSLEREIAEARANPSRATPDSDEVQSRSAS